MPRCLPCDSCFLLSFFAALTPPPHLNSEPLAIGSPSPEDLERLYREELLDAAAKGQNIHVERLLAIEQRVKRKVRELTPTEHDEQ